MTNTVTQVNISVFKPQGYDYGYYVRTTDRGKAIERVLDHFKSERLGFPYINTILAKHTGLDRIEKERYKELLCND